MVPSDVWLVYSQIQQSQKIDQMQHQFAQAVPLCVGDLQDTLLNILRQLEDNTAAKISELEENDRRQDEKLRGAMNRISELEDTSQQQEEYLRVAVARVSELEENDLRQDEELRDAMDKISELEEKVRQFEETVQSLNTTGLKELNAIVDSLSETTAKQDDLDRLDERVTDNIALSQQTHNELNSRINDQNRKVHKNTERITTAERDIKWLKDSVPEQTASWMITSTAVLLVVFSY